MAEKAEKARKNNKNLIVGICAGILIVVVVIVAVIFATRSANGLSDAYFVSDNTKYVLTIDGEETDSEDEGISPAKTHIVYTYSDDTVTGMTTYLDFENVTTAKTAESAYKEAYADVDPSESGIKSISANGKYLVIVATEDQYADITASEVKQQIEFMEMLQNMDLSDTEDGSEETIEIDETTEDE